MSEERPLSAAEIALIQALLPLPVRGSIALAQQIETARVADDKRGTLFLKCSGARLPMDEETFVRHGYDELEVETICRVDIQGGRLHIFACFRLDGSFHSLPRVTSLRPA